MQLLGAFIIQEYLQNHCIPTHVVNEVYRTGEGKVVLYEKARFNNYASAKNWIEKFNYPHLKEMPETNLTTLFDLDEYTL